MQLFAFGVNHQTAPLTVREQVVFHAENLTQALRDLVTVAPGEAGPLLSLAWMPDGRSLLYTRRNGADRTASLWRVPAAGGPPEPLGVQAEGMRDLAVSPDGRHLAWTAGYPRREPWVLEHVLTPR